jgi:hypothetical protein
MRIRIGLASVPLASARFAPAQLYRLLRAAAETLPCIGVRQRDTGSDTKTNPLRDYWVRQGLTFKGSKGRSAGRTEELGCVQQADDIDYCHR